MKVSAKYAKDVENYVLGVILTGGAGGVLLALQSHKDWKELLWSLAFAFVLPLLKRQGVVKNVVAKVSIETGLPTAVVEQATNTVVTKAEEVITDNAPKA